MIYLWNMIPLKELKPQKIIVRMPNWIGDLGHGNACPRRLAEGLP